MKHTMTEDQTCRGSVALVVISSRFHLNGSVQIVQFARPSAFSPAIEVEVVLTTNASAEVVGDNIIINYSFHADKMTN